MIRGQKPGHTGMVPILLAPFFLASEEEGSGVWNRQELWCGKIAGQKSGALHSGSEFTIHLLSDLKHVMFPLLASSI